MQASGGAKRHGTWALLLVSSVLLGGCATGITPSDLKRPLTLTCIDVPQGVEAREVQGLMKFNWTTKLVSGPYISELEDAEGTYYRAPLGGIYIGRDDLADKPPVPLVPRTFNGGIWIPHVPGKPPRLYTYFSTQEAASAPLPENAGCATAVAMPDPQAQGVSTIAFVTGGAVGGATGGAIARTTNSNSTMSYGQAAGVGAAGGAIGGLVVAGLINMDVGKIFHRPPSTDPQFQAALERMHLAVVRIPPASRSGDTK